MTMQCLSMMKVPARQSMMWPRHMHLTGPGCQVGLHLDIVRVHDAKFYLQQTVLQLIQQRLPLVVQVIEIIGLCNCRCCLHNTTGGLG